MSIAEILEWSPERKLELISQLCESISEDQITTTKSQIVELEKRKELDAKGLLSYKDWAEFRDEL